MDVYSIALLLAMLGTGAAVLGGLILRSGTPDAALRRRTLIAAALSEFLAMFSLVYHFATGHRPGTATELPITGFLTEHIAPLVTIVVANIALVLAVIPTRSNPDS